MRRIICYGCFFQFSFQYLSFSWFGLESEEGDAGRAIENMGSILVYSAEIKSNVQKVLENRKIRRQQ